MESGACSPLHSLVYHTTPLITFTFHSYNRGSQLLGKLWDKRVSGLYIYSRLLLFNITPLKVKLACIKAVLAKRSEPNWQMQECLRQDSFEARSTTSTIGFPQSESRMLKSQLLNQIVIRRSTENKWKTAIESYKQTRQQSIDSALSGWPPRLLAADRRCRRRGRRRVGRDRHPSGPPGCSIAQPSRKCVLRSLPDMLSCGVRPLRPRLWLCTAACRGGEEALFGSNSHWSSLTALCLCVVYRAWRFLCMKNGMLIGDNFTAANVRCRPLPLRLWPLCLERTSVFASLRLFTRIYSPSFSQPDLMFACENLLKHSLSGSDRNRGL